MAIPKTMDNDVPGTEYCIGFSSAITRAKELIDRQRTTLGSHERIGVFRIFGRDAGFSALFAAYVTSARCVIPEAPYDLDALAGCWPRTTASAPATTRSSSPRRARSGTGAQLEEVGEPDAFGHRRKADVGEALAAELTPPDGHRVPPHRADLRPAERPAGRARPDRLDDVRQRRDGPRRRRAVRADGRDPRRQVRRDRAARPGRGPAGSTSTRCTTSSDSARATTAGSAGRCCSSA